MTVVKYILLGIYIVVCIALILITTFQSKDNNNSAEDTYENPSTNKYYQKNKGRTKTGKVQRNTIVLGITFAILSVVTAIVFVLL